MGTVTLAPLEVHPDGSETPGYWLDTYSTVMLPADPFAGGSSVTDGSDSTGYTLGAYFVDATTTQYGQAVSGRFAVSGTPVALLVQLRARVNPGWDTSDHFDVVWDWRNGLTDDVSDRFEFGLSSTWGDGRPATTDADGALFPLDNTYQWFTTSYGIPESFIDLSDPSDAGHWVECDLYPGMAEALVAGTFWMSVEIAFTPFGAPALQPMIDISEIRLLVATAGGHRPPLRRYPPVNNGGFGPTRHYPRSVNRRVGGSY